MDKSKKDAAIALKKAQTSINNIIKMIDEGHYCLDIMQQILAVNGLLKSASDKILANHLSTCFSEGMRTDNEESKNKLIKEVVDVISLREKSK
jgi:DNA-binding FrmR family transcriptional regulator